MRWVAIGMGGIFLAACAVAGAAPPPDRLAAVGGMPKLPVGTPGSISVVAQAKYGSYGPGTILPVAVRNNRKKPVTGIHVAGSALDAKGRLIVTGEDDGVQPVNLPAGGLAIGFVRFGGKSLPAGTRFKLDVTDTPAEAAVGFAKQVDVPITSVRYAGGKVTGSGTNTTGKRVSRPIVVLAACFNRANALVAFAKAFGAKGAVPGQAIPFTVDFTRGGAPACAHVLVSMTGYSEL